MPAVRKSIERLKVWQSSRRAMLWSLLMLSLFMLGLQVFLETRFTQRQLDSQREDVANQLGNIRSQLESTLAKQDFSPITKYVIISLQISV